MKIMLFEEGKARECLMGDLAQALKSDTQMVWCDVVDPDDESFSIMRDVFHFHPLAIEDTRKHHQRPKLEEKDQLEYERRQSGRITY
jgi:magnesium transporter